jgi:hypothetical protein
MYVDVPPHSTTIPPPSINRSLSLKQINLGLPGEFESVSIKVFSLNVAHILGLCLSK